MKTHLAVSADSSASAAEPWLCVCSSVPFLCSLDPGQTKHTQTVAVMLRTNGDGHSGDPFQLENYRLGIFISCYVELFHPAPRGRSVLIPKGEIQPITLSHISHWPGQSCTGSTGAHFGVVQDPVCWYCPKICRDLGTKAAGEGWRGDTSAWHPSPGAALAVTATLIDHCSALPSQKDLSLLARDVSASCRVLWSCSEYHT